MGSVGGFWRGNGSIAGEGGHGRKGLRCPHGNDLGNGIRDSFWIAEEALETKWELYRQGV